MIPALRPAIVVSVIFLVLLGLAYPLAETGIGRAFFSRQASGSLTGNGSTLVGQAWTGPRWFQGRPDAYNPMATGGTNLGPRSRVLVRDARQRMAVLAKEGITPTPDLVTTSGSGVDPDISPADAYAQVSAVARGVCPPPRCAGWWPSTSCRRSSASSARPMSTCCSSTRPWRG